MGIIIAIKWDNEASVWRATNTLIRLSLWSRSYDALVGAVESKLPKLLDINNIKNCTYVIFTTYARKFDIVNTTELQDAKTSYKLVGTD